MQSLKYNWQGWLLPLLSQGPWKSKDAQQCWVGPSPAAKLLAHMQKEKQKAAKVEGENELTLQLMLLRCCRLADRCLPAVPVPVPPVTLRCS